MRHVTLPTQSFKKFVGACLHAWSVDNKITNGDLAKVLNDSNRLDAEINVDHIRRLMKSLHLSRKQLELRNKRKFTAANMRYALLLLFVWFFFFFFFYKEEFTCDL